MKKENFYILLIVLLVTLNLVVLGTFWWGRDHHFPPPHHHGPHGGPDRMFRERLHFTDAQIAGFDTLREEHHTKQDSLMKERKKLYEAYFSILKIDQIDLAMADSINSIIAANQKLLNENTFDHFMKIRQLCKPEQLEDYNEFILELGRMLSFPPPPGGPRGHHPPPPPHDD